MSEGEQTGPTDPTVPEEAPVEVQPGGPGSGPPPGYGTPGPAGPSYASGASWAEGAWPPGLPALPSSERIRLAWEQRGESDYIFNFWTALGWTILTLGIYGFYAFYQLVRRMRDHKARRLELLDAAISLGWEEAGRRGLQAELTPSFQRAAAHLAVMRRMTSDFRDPVIWLLLSIIASGIVHIIAFIFLDQDLVNHDRAEMGVEYEIALIYGRFGHTLPLPDTDRVKGQHNYHGPHYCDHCFVRSLLLLVVARHDGRAELPLLRQLVPGGLPGCGRTSHDLNLSGEGAVVPPVPRR